MDIRKKKNSRRLSPRTPSSVLKPRPNAAEAEEIVLAIRRGGIDALVMQGAQGEKVVTLQGTEHPYRVLVESINDGAATLDADGIVLYANSRFAQILNIPVGKLTGSSLHNNLSAGQSDKLKKLIRQALHRSSAAELTLDATAGRPKLVRFTLRPLKDSDIHKVGVVATELTELVVEVRGLGRRLVDERALAEREREALVVAVVGGEQHVGAEAHRLDEHGDRPPDDALLLGDAEAGAVQAGGGREPDAGTMRGLPAHGQPQLTGDVMGFRSPGARAARPEGAGFRPGAHRV